MTKIENESESAAVDGYFYHLKTPIVLSKIPSATANTTTGVQSPTAGNSGGGEKVKDFIDVKVKVVSTQLTQNGTFYY
jgi:hypothetical protein